MNPPELILRPKHMKGDDGYKTFSIRIRESTVSQIDALSAETSRSRNELIGIFLEYALKHCVVLTEDAPP